MSEVISEERKQGRVKWFNDSKGYGFIVVEDQKGDVFVHRQQLIRSGLPSLTEGEKVSFVLQKGRKGLFAIKISREK